jgi:asparagine synthase (glutamine-hydrolysing)
MCGIAGIISHDPALLSRDRLAKMTNALAHRGPDGEQIWLDANIALGHRRLAIIDLSDAASQPMHCLNRYSILHNGEIYNYIELRDFLEKKGYEFHTKSDTEVIVAAYDHYGQECLQHFDGMFAFSIWDSVERNLFAARDRFGEKPFFYYLDAAQFVWASELKAIWAAGIERHCDNTMLLNFLALGWLQDPTEASRTFFEKIQSLPQSHFLVYNFDKAEITITRYWDIDKEVQKEEIEEDAWIEVFREQFFNSVKLRLRSDVSVGTSLSGGVDSSSVVAAISRFKDYNRVRNSFTCVLPGFEKDESSAANRIANEFHLSSFITSPDIHQFLDHFDRLLWHQDEPIGSASAFLQYQVMALAKEQDTKVLLDGQGADEILSGYSKYIHWWLQELIAGRQFSKAIRERKEFSNHTDSLNWGWKNWLAALLPAQAANRLEKNAVASIKRNSELNPEFVQSNFDRYSIFKPLVTKLNDILYFNSMQFGLQELLRYADRNSMAHGREIRLPFLSYQLVETIFRAPSSMKMKNGFGKYLLRKSLEKDLPQEIAWQKTKIGFEAPQQEWMKHPVMLERVRESRRQLVDAGVLRKKVLDQPLRALPSYAEGNFDWRYLVAAKTLL